MPNPKEKRQALICQFIHTEKITNQRRLQDLLAQKGIQATQATISRDMIELNIGKERRENEPYAYYRIATLTTTGNKEFSRTTMRTQGVRSIHYSGNLVVLKTRSGYANSICVDIDAVANSAIIGTIAGDDTLLVIPADGVTRDEVRRILAQIIPEIASL